MYAGFALSLYDPPTPPPPPPPPPKKKKKQKKMKEGNQTKQQKKKKKKNSLKKEEEKTTKWILWKGREPMQLKNSRLGLINLNPHSSYTFVVA